MAFLRYGSDCEFEGWTAAKRPCYMFDRHSGPGIGWQKQPKMMVKYNDDAAMEYCDQLEMPRSN